MDSRWNFGIFLMLGEGKNKKGVGKNIYREWKRVGEIIYRKWKRVGGKKDIGNGRKKRDGGGERRYSKMDKNDVEGKKIKFFEILLLWVQRTSIPSFAKTSK